MKHVLITLITAGLLLAVVGCSSDEENPQFRVRNERSDKANVQLKTTGGSTININDVTAGQTTTYQSASAGTFVVTAVIQNESVSPTVSFSGGKDKLFTVVILAGNIPTLRIDQ